MSDRYCPHEIVADPRAFELVTYADESPFGRQTGFKSAQPTTDTVWLLLHGVGGNRASWTPLLTELMARNGGLPDLIVPDLPGFGESENLTDHLRARSVGTYLMDLAFRSGWSRVHLVGHSMGGFLGLDMAGGTVDRTSASITRLSIISGAYFGVIDVVNQPVRSVRANPDIAAVYASMKLLAALGPVGTRLMARVSDSRLAEPLLARLIASPKLLLPGVRRNILTNLRPTSFNLAAQNGVGYDADEHWRGIAVPTLAIFGATDHLVPPADAAHLATLLPAAQIEMLPGVGHFALVEKPGAVARHLGLPVG